MNMFARCATSPEQVDRFHPGPDFSLGDALPARPTESTLERLRRLEAIMLACAIEQNVHQKGELGELAVTIIALRAQVTG